MNEREWLEGTSARSMLDYLEVFHNVARTKRGRRKLRLLACAVFRRCYLPVTTDKWGPALDLAERYAEGLADRAEVVSFRERFPREHWLDRTVDFLLAESPQRATTNQAFGRYGVWREDDPTAEFVRELFGNPFRRSVLDPVWRSSTVVALAQAAYDERSLTTGQFDPSRLGILADALEDAGCDNADILNHCRGPGPHVRGCWVLDLLLGKG